MGVNYLSFNENGDADRMPCVDGEQVFSEELRERCTRALETSNSPCSRLILDLAVLSTQLLPSVQAQFWLGRLAPQELVQELILLVDVTRGFEAGTEFSNAIGRAKRTA